MGNLTLNHTLSHQSHQYHVIYLGIYLQGARTQTMTIREYHFLLYIKKNLQKKKEVNCLVLNLECKGHLQITGEPCPPVMR